MILRFGLERTAVVSYSAYIKLYSFFFQSVHSGYVNYSSQSEYRIRISRYLVDTTSHWYHPSVELLEILPTDWLLLKESIYNSGLLQILLSDWLLFWKSIIISFTLL